jgi:hypothetical protein
MANDYLLRGKGGVVASSLSPGLEGWFICLWLEVQIPPGVALEGWFICLYTAPLGFYLWFLDLAVDALAPLGFFVDLEGRAPCSLAFSRVGPLGSICGCQVASTTSSPRG